MSCFVEFGEEHLLSVSEIESIRKRVSVQEPNQFFVEAILKGGKSVSSVFDTALKQGNAFRKLKESLTNKN